MSNRSELHQQNLEKIFYPKSVALVGVTQAKNTVPYDIMQGILFGGYKGIIYPVSPGSKHIFGFKTYKYVLDIEGPVDLAIIVFPSSVCHLALEQCGQKGIKSVIIISAGFKEVGEKGLQREKQLLEIARKYDISFIGPNCLGMINADPSVCINASFARKMPAAGNIGFLSQSGALCTAVLDYAQAKGIGFSKFVSFGNKADISEIDLMYYLMRDEQTKVILLYLEEVSDGRALMKAAQDIIEQSGKPVLIIKSGRTSEGASAAASHTGSLAGSDEVCDAGFAQGGIIRCDHIEEMFNIAIAFVYQPIPVSDRVAIITNAGGPGVLTTDAIIKEGMKIARFNEETTAILKKALPNTANIKNPVDVIGDATAARYNAAIKPIFEDPGVDAVLIILTPQSMTDIEEIAQEVVDVAKMFDKPIYASFMGEADVAPGIRILQDNKIPHYSLPESMSHALTKVYQFGQLKNKEFEEVIPFDDLDHNQVKEILGKAVAAKDAYLPEYKASSVLKSYGLPVLGGGMARTEQEVKDLVQQLEYPLVMKVQSQDIVHKVDVGGVVLNIDSEEAALESFQAIHSNVGERAPEAVVDGIYVTRQVPKGVEVILGMKRDPSFGPVIMFGLGGIYVEVFKDVSFRVAPISRGEAVGMIQEIQAYKLLAGTRGENPKDVESIVDAIMRLSQLCVDHPEIQELDINPMIVLDQGKGCYVADAKIMI